MRADALLPDAVRAVILDHGLDVMAAMMNALYLRDTPVRVEVGERAPVGVVERAEHVEGMRSGAAQLDRTQRLRRALGLGEHRIDQREAGQPGGSIRERRPDDHVIVVSSDTVRDLIPQLLENGAEGIIEYPLNKVV